MKQIALIFTLIFTLISTSCDNTCDNTCEQKIKITEKKPEKCKLVVRFENNTTDTLDSPCYEYFFRLDGNLICGNEVVARKVVTYKKICN